VELLAGHATEAQFYHTPGFSTLFAVPSPRLPTLYGRPGANRPIMSLRRIDFGDVQENVQEERQNLGVANPCGKVRESIETDGK
jgi:hypothetical protein